MSDFYNKIIENNKNWVANNLKLDPEFFKKLSKTQSPPLLWIGCSDSRVPANQIIGAAPGEVFVHRNIANMVIHTDMNLLSVLDYSVNVLQVKHIIVCGHYGCGGVKAAMNKNPIGIIDNWIRHIRDSYNFGKHFLDKIEDEKTRFDQFVEWNIKHQVYNLAITSIVQKAWSKGQKLSLHGWVYGIETGLIKDLDVTFESSSDIEDDCVYKLEYK
ncbi:MAG: carbonate dehydratase [Bacteroidia bacterium]|nr:carbonate dehydratase [Bacteroidia bacterium]